MPARLRPLRRAPVAFAAAIVAGAAVATAYSLDSGPPGWSRDVVSRVPTVSRVVALTVDDGPDPRWTPSLLRLLRREGVRATFFLVGWRVAADPWLARAEVAAGDDLGNHTYWHRNLVALEPAAVRAQIVRAADAFRRAGLPSPRFFRPPFGRTDGTVEAIARRLGYCTVLWSLGVERYADVMPAREAIAHLLRRVRPGTIILAHDAGPGRWRTLAVLPGFLSGLRSRGYRVVDLDELLRETHATGCSSRTAARTARQPLSTAR